MLYSVLYGAAASGSPVTVSTGLGQLTASGFAPAEADAEMMDLIALALPYVLDAPRGLTLVVVES